MVFGIPLKKIGNKNIAIPQDHGSWVFILSPLIIGICAGGTWRTELIPLVISAISIFLIRQPVTVIVKLKTGRRGIDDLPVALFWSLFYGIIILISFLHLVKNGFGYLFLLAIPGLVAFSVHLYLVSRRSERRQIAVEVFATGTLALAAPASFWVSIGNPDPQGWWLFLLVWMQSTVSIIYIYLRLNQRIWNPFPPVKERIKLGLNALLSSLFSLIIVISLSVLGKLPYLLFLPYLLQFIETIYGTMNPAVGKKPTEIGFRQLLISTIFTLLFVITWRL